MRIRKTVIAKVVAILMILTSMSSCSFSDLDMQSSERAKVKVGDNLRWANPNYDDSEWAFHADPPIDSIFWVRIPVNLTALSNYSKLAIRLGAVGSYDFYWDGVFIGNNGNIRTDKGETFVEGNYIHFEPLPDSLTTKGKHMIALRCDNPYNRLGHHAYATIGNFSDILTLTLKISLAMFVVGGIFLTAGFYFLIMFISNRKDYSSIIFASICFVFLLLLFLEYLKLFYQYPYTFQKDRLEYIGYLHFALTFLIPSFLMIELRFPHWKKLIVVLAFLAIGFQIICFGQFDILAKIQNQLMWITSSIIVIFAVWQRKREAYFLLVGMILSMLVFLMTPIFDVPFVSSFDISLFLSFICIVISMLYVLIFRRKEEQRAYQLSSLLSERLKIELLRKNIKPHFIMNTLTTLIDWVEESPQDGVALITVLAEEFNLLNDMVDHKLVPISSEIKLCSNHLEVMSYRKEIKYTWENHNIDYDEVIPPAIIHTLVENGVTHTRGSDEIIFSLTFSKSINSKKYDLTVSGQQKVNPDHGIGDKHEGTGTKYIKSRLQESYGDHWSFESRPSSTGWHTTITIRNPQN